VTGKELIHKFSVRAADDDADAVEQEMTHLRTGLRLPDLTMWHDYYVEFSRALSGGELAAVAAALGDGEIGTRVVVDEALDPDTMVQVAHRRGVVDNESESIVAMCALLDLPARAGKVAVTYSSALPRLAEVIRATRYNQSVEELHLAEPAYDTLIPLGRYAPAERFNLLGLDDERLAALGRANGRNLSLEQMRRIRVIQQETGGAPVTDVLLEALDARWSDHCSHTTWRSLGSLLSRLVDAAGDTGNPNIVSMFVDNAGVWDFYGGHALAIKAETHNGPSAVSAYFGQLTKLGGVLRDILGTGLGADPIGCFEYTATGLPDTPSPIAGRPAPRQIALDTIRAIKEYGNTFGVPMMSSRMAFHPDYRAKPFALGGSIGIIPKALAQRGRPQPGDLVMLIGGLTGNEGIHGASASSAGATMDEAAVQIGAPLEQVKFRKAILDLRDAGCLRALTDLGAAGLNSAVGEIGEACGVWMNTALVPLKTSALPMWRILLSESQERMVLAVPAAKLGQAREITARHQVRATVIGRFTSTGRYGVCHAPALDEDAVIDLPVNEFPHDAGDHDAGELGFDVPYELLGFEPAPRPVDPVPSPAPVVRTWPQLRVSEVAKLLESVAGDLEVAGQQYADAQYDSTVQGNTAHGPQYGSRLRVPSTYWAATPVEDLRAAVVFTTAFAPSLYQAHPVRALRQMFCALLGRQVLAGVALPDICVCDNFYTPHLSEDAGEWLVGMVDELAALVRHFGTPVISGKDSSAGSSHTDEGLVHVPPAVFLSGLGKVAHVDRLLGEEWTAPGRALVRIGPACPSPAATVAARVLGIGGNVVDDVDLSAFRDYLDAVAAARHLFRSGTTIGPGGIAALLVTGALASGLGADLEPAGMAGLFAEHRCAALVEVAPEDMALLPAELTPMVVARTTAVPGVRLGEEQLLTPAVQRRWAGSFTARIGAEPTAPPLRGEECTQ
jgi:phosphoribosylformylglycinamidine (FGAM) synthase-like enzyme